MPISDPHRLQCETSRLPEGYYDPSPGPWAFQHIYGFGNVLIDRDGRVLTTNVRRTSGAMMFTDHCVLGFRALEHTDLPLVHRWLNEPCVLKWYAKHPFSEREVAAKYAPRIDGREQVRVFVAAVDHTPVGLMQTYWLSDSPGYALSIGAESGWAGVDFFIGESEFRSRGLGARLLDQFVRQQVFALLKSTACISGPSPNNVKSVRTLERAAFTYLRTVEVFAGEIERVMIRRFQHAA